MPTQASRRSIKMSWSTVSNAELRSRRIKIEQLPISAVSSKSLVTAVSHRSLSGKTCRGNTQGYISQYWSDKLNEAENKMKTIFKVSKLVTDTKVLLKLTSGTCLIFLFKAHWWMTQKWNIYIAKKWISCATQLYITCFSSSFIFFLQPLLQIY